MKIQPQEAVAAFQAMVTHPEYRPRRVAFVVSPSLFRAQLMRTLPQDHSFGVFQDEQKAEAWLLGGEEEAEAARRALSGPSAAAMTSRPNDPSPSRGLTRSFADAKAGHVQRAAGEARRAGSPGRSCG